MHIDTLLASAAFFILVAYLLTNECLQRSFHLTGMLLLFLCGLIGGYQNKYMLALLIFSGLGVLINSFILFLNVKECFSTFLPEEVREIKSYFPFMTNSEFLEIYDISQQKKHKHDELMIQQDSLQNNLFLIVKGEAEVRKDNQPIATVKKGKLIGEMSYITGNLTNASVIVSSDELEALEWNKKRLDKLRLRRPEVFNKFYQTLAINLVDKVSIHRASDINV